MTATSLGQSSPRPAPAPFPPNHAWDRNFYLLAAGCAWFGILAGFVPDVVKHVTTHARPFPLIVHFHAVAFLGWLVLFTVQILLIRAKRPALHRKLGFAMLGLAAIMMVLGPATALIADHGEIGTPDADPAFLSIQFSDILAFVGLLSAAVVFRNNAPVHKRLVLMGTIYITDAGFARWLGGPFHSLFAQTPLSHWAPAYGGTMLLFLGVGLYDLITRRRLHPAYVTGMVWVLVIEVTALVLYATPSWTKLAAGWIAAA